MVVSEIERWLLVGLASVAVLFWIMTIVRFLRNQPLLKAQMESPILWQPEDVLVGLAAFLLLPGIAMGLVAQQPVHIRLLFASFGSLASMALVCGFLYVRYGRESFVAGERKLVRNLFYGGLTFVVWIPLVLGIQAALVKFFPYEHQTITTLTDAAPRQQMTIAVITFFSAAIVAPIVEEFFFRWLLQNWLQKLFVKWLPQFFELRDDCPVSRPVGWPAILITSFLFAAVHGGQGPAPVALFVLALAIGYLFDRTRSLTACIFVHFLLNAMTMSFVIARQFTEGQGI